MCTLANSEDPDEIMPYSVAINFMTVYTLLKQNQYSEKEIQFLFGIFTMDHPKFIVLNPWVKVFRIIPEFRILKLTFHRKSASKSELWRP